MGGSGVSANYAGTALTSQIDTAIASGARNLVMMGGVNDVINGASTSDIQAAWLVILTKALNAGMKVWWCTAPYMNAAYGSYTVARQAQLMYLNEWIKQLVYTQYSRDGVVVIDTNSKSQDPASATADYITNGSYDGLHPRNLAAYQMGKELARVWSLLVPEAPQLTTSAAENKTYSSTANNLLSNGLMTASGGGLATGYASSTTGTGGTTNSIVSRSDGFGSDQQMIVTFSANNDSARFTTADVKANVSSGDLIWAECEISLSSMTATRCVRMQLTATGGNGSKTSACLQLDSTNDSALTDTYTGVYKTVPFVVDTSTLGTLTNVSAQAAAFGTGSGGVTMKIGRFSIRKMIAS